MLQNVHRIEGDVTYLSLTRGQETVISTSDLERVLQVRWYAEYIKSEDTYRARGRYQGKPIFLSRYVMDAKEDEWVDHINFDTLDNRRENLRLVTPSENRIHQRRKPGKTGLQYIQLINRPGGYQQYFVSMMRNGALKAKAYPCTPEGLQAAKDLVAKWQEDFSYEPERTTSHRRKRRDNWRTSTSSEIGPHTNREKPEKEQQNDNLTNLDNVVLVPLSKGQKAIIDKADVEKATKYTWFAGSNSMGSYYAMRRTETGGSMYMHRYLLDAPDGMYVDHINHNTLDNRRSNLRLVTNQEQC